MTAAWWRHDALSPIVRGSLAALAVVPAIEPAVLARAVVGVEAHSAMIACLFCDTWKGTVWLGGDAGYICRRHLRAFFDGLTATAAGDASRTTP